LCDQANQQKFVVNENLFMNNTLLRISLALWLIGLAACNVQPPPAWPARCNAAPPFEETAQRLAHCLNARATARDALNLLVHWQRATPRTVPEEHGAVLAANLLPAAGDELVAVFYPDLGAARIWNPRGALVVLQHVGGMWRVAFDASAIKIETPQGAPWTNWIYSPQGTDDLTGDGLDDLHVQMSWSNGTHGWLDFHAVLAATPNGSTLRVIALQDNTHERAKFEVIEDADQRKLQSVHALGESGRAWLTRTLAYNGNVLTVTHEIMDPPLAMIEALHKLNTPNLTKDSDVVREAAAIVMPVFSYSAGEPMRHPEELVLAEVGLLKLEQIARRSGENTDPNKNSDPNSRVFQEYMTSAARRTFADVGVQPAAKHMFVLFGQVWAETQDFANACTAIAEYAEQHRAATLLRYAQAGRGALHFEVGTSLCVR
jgi:hypothetical protein